MAASCTQKDCICWECVCVCGPSWINFLFYDLELGFMISAIPENACGSTDLSRHSWIFSFPSPGRWPNWFEFRLEKTGFPVPAFSSCVHSTSSSLAWVRLDAEKSRLEFWFPKTGIEHCKAPVSGAKEHFLLEEQTVKWRENVKITTIITFVTVFPAILILFLHFSPSDSLPILTVGIHKFLHLKKKHFKK